RESPPPPPPPHTHTQTPTHTKIVLAERPSSISEVIACAKHFLLKDPPPPPPSTTLRGGRTNLQAKRESHACHRTSEGHCQEKCARNVQPSPW
ncbi:hypothetical protein IscW_ISCW002251, partial [Ixodes scapularis]